MDFQCIEINFSTAPFYSIKMYSRIAAKKQAVSTSTLAPYSNKVVAAGAFMEGSKPFQII
jgi:hypothetical protein